MMLTIAGAMLLAVCWRSFDTRIPPLDRKELDRHRRLSEEKCRDWMYPFE